MKFTEELKQGKTGRAVKHTPDLLQASEKLMDYLSFMVRTDNKKYPFKPSFEGEKALHELNQAITKAKTD